MGESLSALLTSNNRDGVLKLSGVFDEHGSTN